MTPHDLARMYVDKGREDENAAAKLLDDDSISDSIVGFHLQQAAEKYLKAVLALHEIRISKTHNIADLILQLQDTSMPVPDEFDPSADLSPYAVRARYPFDLGKPGALNRPEMKSLVSRIRGWAEQQIAG
jgi:HEPN domain-containing protein